MTEPTYRRVSRKRIAVSVGTLPAHRSRRHSVGRLRRDRRHEPLAPLVISFVGLDVAVAEADDAAGPAGDVALVRDHDDGLARVVELAQKGHDLLAGSRVEVAGRL